MSNQAVSAAKVGKIARSVSVAWAWGRARPRLTLVGLAVVVGLILLVGLAGGGGASADVATVAIVEQGPLLISITENGTIRAKNNLEMKCGVEGRSTITYIIPEGARVKKDDLLVELDSGDLKERLTQQQLSFEDAKAGLANAQAQFDITESKNQSSIEKASQDLQFAEMDLEKWLGGTPGATPETVTSSVPEAPATADVAPEAEASPAVPVGDVQDSELETILGKLAQLARLDVEGSDLPLGDEKLTEEQQRLIDGRFEEQQQLVEEIGESLKVRLDVAAGEGEQFKEEQRVLSDISLALGSLSQAQNKLRWTVRLKREGHASSDELTTDRLSAARARANLVADILDYRLLKKYAWRKELVSLISSVREAGRELDRVKYQAEASKAQSDAELRKRQAQLQLQTERRDKLEKQVEATRVLAPQDGLVVYPRVQRWRGTEQLMEVGSQVNQQQVLVTLPDLSELIVDTKVYESEVNKVRVGQRALVKVAALAHGEEEAPALEGQVTKIAMLPNYGDRWLNPEQKTFNVEVNVDESREEVRSQLKPEMTAEVSIILAQLQEVTHVPIQAITKLGDQQVCYRVTRGGPQPVPVRVGMTNTLRAQIISGLEKGDKVLLVPPISEAVSAEALGIPGVPTEAGGAPAPTPAPGQGEPVPTAVPSQEEPTAQEPPAPAQPVDLEAVLSRLPEDRREAMRQSLEGMSPEERQQTLERMARGRGRGAGAGRPEGQRRQPQE